MQPNYYYMRTLSSHPQALFHTVNASLNYCCNQIGTPKQPFYIGVTNNPKLRLDEHIEEKEMSHMYVLCHVRGNQNAKDLESNLIAHYFNNKYCMNQTAIGGGGIVGDNNYIYLLYH